MRPRLIHPSSIKIARVDRTGTTWDADFGAPVGDIKYLPPETVMAQVKFDRYNAEQMLAQGDSPMTTGHLAMYPAEAAMFGKGDKIVEIDGIPTEAYITEIRPAAHSAKGPGLMLLLFEERRKGT